MTFKLFKPIRKKKVSQPRHFDLRVFTEGLDTVMKRKLPTALKDKEK